MQPDRFSNAQVLTTLVCLAFILLLLCYDLVLVVLGKSEATISVVVNKLVKRAPVLAFLLGMVVGHLVWPITRFYDDSAVPEVNHASQCGNGSEESKLSPSDNSGGE